MMKQCLALCGLMLLILGCQAKAPPPESAPKTASVVVTQATFDAEVREAKQPVLVEFFDPKDDASKAIAPVMDKLAGEYNGQAVVAVFDAKDNDIIAQRFGVETLPTFILFKQGEPVERIRGAATQEQLRKMLGPLMGK